MTRAGVDDLRARSALVALACGLLAALVPLLSGGSLGALDVAAVLVAVAVAASLGARHQQPIAALHRLTSGQPRATRASGPLLSSRIPDPVHHPVSPRAPGRV